MKLNHKQIVKAFQLNNWTFAKTMPENPHFYTLRKSWDDDNFFVDCVQFIRDFGEIEVFKGRKYICLNLNGYKYWTMGAPLHQTTLINRCVIHYKTDYDDLAENYDTLFNAVEFIEEDNQLKLFLKDYLNGNVLDIGCGTGKLLDLFHVEQYLGIDICKNMLDIHKNKFNKPIINTSFEHFDGFKFDNIISLYGSISYIKNPIDKIKSMLNDEGKFFLMFYEDDYFPVTHKNGVNDLIVKNCLSGVNFKNYKIITNENI